MTPQVAYMQSLGLETMDLRYQKASGTAAEIARRIQTIPGIQSVNYIGLPDNPFYEISVRQFGINPGAMLTFDLKSKDECFSWMNNLKMIRRATNLFDNKTLAIHPYTTIFGNFSVEAKMAMHIFDTTIRLSVGLEEADDLMQDILQALTE